MLSGFSSKTLKAEAQGSVHISTRYLSSGQVGVQCSLLLGSQNSLEHVLPIKIELVRVQWSQCLCLLPAVAGLP
jgi:hypothetical protein